MDCGHPEDLGMQVTYALSEAQCPFVAMAFICHPAHYNLLFLTKISSILNQLVKSSLCMVLNFSLENG